MAVTSPLKELIEDIISTEKPLSTSLMKLKYFGRLISNEELDMQTKSPVSVKLHFDKFCFDD